MVTRAEISTICIQFEEDYQAAIKTRRFALFVFLFYSPSLKLSFLHVIYVREDNDSNV